MSERGVLDTMQRAECSGGAMGLSPWNEWVVEIHLISYLDDRKLSDTSTTHA